MKLERVDSTDRGPSDYLRFALGFGGFILSVSGVIVGSPALTVFGGGMLLLVVVSYLNG